MVGCKLFKGHKMRQDNMDRYYLRRYSNRLYSIYENMKNRCNNKNTPDYKNYGAKGVYICTEWENDFDKFVLWSISNGYKNSLSIDRINNDGNYEPNNCRWATCFIQRRNTRKLKLGNTSGFRGITQNKNTKRWQSKICVNRNRISLGTYKCKTCAALAYDTYVIDNNLEHTRNF